MEIEEMLNITNKAWVAKNTLTYLNKRIQPQIKKDITKIGNIYADCAAVNEKRFFVVRLFIFCVLFLYSPYSLFGQATKPNIRAEMTKYIGVKNGASVSFFKKNVMTMYETSERFRKHVYNIILKYRNI